MDVPGWQLTSDIAKEQAGGPTGRYVNLSSDTCCGVTLISSPFTVGRDTTGFYSLWRTYFTAPYASNALDIRVLSDPAFSTDTRVLYDYAPGISDWQKLRIDLRQYVGQTIKLEIKGNNGPTRITEVATDELQAKIALDKTVAHTPDPVNTISGNFYHSNTDISILGKGIPLEFTRYYNSMGSTSGPLGYHWTDNYSFSLTADSDGSITLRYPAGNTAFFPLSNGVFQSPPGDNNTLVKNGDGTYTLTTKSQVIYTFLADGVLTSIADRNNNTTTLSYANGLLSSVTDPGRAQPGNNVCLRQEWKPGIGYRRKRQGNGLRLRQR